MKDEKRKKSENQISETDPSHPESQTLSLVELPQALREAVKRAGWKELMPVQARSIPYLLEGRDIMVQSRTGSGKTGAFLLPMLGGIDPTMAACQALILVPTRELAKQVHAEAERLSAESGIHAVAVYGGVSYRPQVDAFRRGVQIVVGTPGRVLDHLLKRNLTLSRLEYLVFDEADRMLSMGFYPDMKQVRRYLPERRVKSSMFSATYPPHVLRLANQFLYDPEFLSLSTDQVHVAETEHVVYTVPPMDKDRCLVRIIEMENPASALIFCNTKSRVHYVTVVLQRFGYDADELSSDLSQNDREKVLGRVRNGSLRFLVATDVAARGIDIPDLSHVILYEPPEDPEGYIHRAGRTGRAGAGGTAISLVGGMETFDLKRIATRYSIELEERSMPSDEDIQRVVEERVTALLEARLRERDRIEVERMQRFVPLGRSLAESEDESAIIAMLLDDYYQETIHRPPLVPREEVSRDRPVREASRKNPGKTNRGKGGSSGRRKN